VLLQRPKQMEVLWGKVRTVASDWLLYHLLHGTPTKCCHLLKNRMLDQRKSYMLGNLTYWTCLWLHYNNSSRNESIFWYILSLIGMSVLSSDVFFLDFELLDYMSVVNYCTYSESYILL
jgi:hypothetical protein